MSESSTQPPQVSIRLSLCAPVYHFSNPTPLTLNVSLTLSAASQPITIGIPYGSPLDMKFTMSHGGFPITDLTSSPPKSVEITDMTGRVNRRPTPPRRLCLQPGKPCLLSVAFTRGGSYDREFRPQPWHIVERGQLLDEDGNELDSRRPQEAAGLDGLEAGKRYRATVAVEKLSKITWWSGCEGEEADRSESTAATMTAATMTAASHSQSDREPEQTSLAFHVEEGGVEFSVEE